MRRFRVREIGAVYLSNLFCTVLYDVVYIVTVL